LAPGPLPARGPVLVGAFAAAIQGVARAPLAFTIQDIANCLTAGGAAVACWVADRVQRRFMAPRAGAQRRRQENFCCVTTRCRNFRCLRRLGQRLGTRTARTLGVGVLGLGRIILASSRLPPRRLPAAEFPPAFGVLAVTLVPAPRLILLPTPFAQTDPQPRSSRTGMAAVLWLTMTAAHGSVDLPRVSPGRTR
jgi:hypothetical protein